MRPDTANANRYLHKSLLGTCVESFGLTHQVLTLTFRDSNTNDHTLWIETAINANTSAFNSPDLDANARCLLLFNSVNLQSITEIYCTDEYDLVIQFANGTRFILDSTAADEYGEPWSINLSTDTYSANIIANCGGGYLIFDSRFK